MLQPLTLEAVVPDLYRAILGRDPESREAIESHIDRGSAEAVARALLESEEYKSKARTAFTLVDCYDFRVFLPEGDWMYDSLVKTGVYEPYVIEPFREACRDARVLDVGANIGIFSIIAAKQSDKQVTAVEIATSNAKLVSMNASLNGCSNIEIFPIGASDVMGSVKTFGGQSNKTVRAVDVTAETFAYTDVSFCMPLDMIVRDRVDVFKIDVEGHEYKALLGAKGILDGRPTVFAEFSPEFMREVSGVEPSAVLNIFFDRGYEATILHRDMAQEQVRQSERALVTAWEGYRDRGITHIDLMLKAAH